MTSTVNRLNKHVSAFLVENAGSEDLNTLWLSLENQKQVKSIVSNSNLTVRRKDANAPKRGKSAYLFFCAESRDAVRTALGATSKATEITSELGKRWNELKKTPGKVKKFEAQAEADKARYLKDKETYVPPPDCEGPVGKQRRRKGPKTGPKRAKSAYLCFCEEERGNIKAETPDMSAVDITRELGVRWSKIKDDTKAKRKYVEQATEDRARFDREKAEMSGGSAPTAPTPKVSAKPATTPKATKSAPPPAATPKGKAGKPGKAAKSKPAAQVAEEVVEEEDVVETPAPTKRGRKAKGN